ncbi:MAG: hypothetical protein WDO69_08645 [Pseudomonadota bacterium]
MSRIQVSTTKEVLERFRLEIVANLKARGFSVPSEVEISGNCFEAFVAWQRLEHRGISTAPRIVNESPELLGRNLDPAIRAALLDIRAEFERGEDMTHRLTRQFYRSGFNDFLFNNFGMQHLHLGATGAGWDRTKKHPMSGSGSDLLFVLTSQTEAYFLDIHDHNAFERSESAKPLAQLALRNRPDLLEPYIAPDVVGADQTFEDAFLLAKAGFATVYELDGRFLLTGGTVIDGRVSNGKRAACTSGAVIDAANRVLNMVARLVKHVSSKVDELADVAESRTGVRTFAFELEVVQAGRCVHLREINTGLTFVHTGHRLGLLADAERQEIAKPTTT